MNTEYTAVRLCLDPCSLILEPNKFPNSSILIPSIDATAVAVVVSTVGIFIQLDRFERVISVQQ